MQEPKQDNWDAALRVVRYLKHNPGQCIFLCSDSPFTLNVWCDADWTGCPLTRRSLTGWFIHLGNSPISWKTSKQQTVYLSSAEAEYRALSFTVREILWLKGLLGSFGVEHTDQLLFTVIAWLRFTYLLTQCFMKEQSMLSETVISYATRSSMGRSPLNMFRLKTSLQTS